MLFTKIIVNYGENTSKHKNKLLGQNSIFRNTVLHQVVIYLALEIKQLSVMDILKFSLAPRNPLRRHQDVRGHTGGWSVYATSSTY